MVSIRENLLAAIAAVEAEPDKLFRLRDFEVTTDCGTLHCTLGLLATLPRFNEQGLSLRPQEGFNRLVPRLVGDADRVFSDKWHEALDALFGAESYDRLFEPAMCGQWDSDLAANLDNKQLALARLTKQLGLYP